MRLALGRFARGHFVRLRFAWGHFVRGHFVGLRFAEGHFVRGHFVRVLGTLCLTRRFALWDPLGAHLDGHFVLASKLPGHFVLWGPCLRKWPEAEISLLRRIGALGGARGRSLRASGAAARAGRARAALVSAPACTCALAAPTTAS